MKQLLSILCVLISTVTASASIVVADTTIALPSKQYFYTENTVGYRPVLFVNEAITTHLVMPENIKLVDLSTDKVVGNQCADNVVRLKPNAPMEHNEFLATITVIGERNIALYDLVYTTNTQLASPLFYIPSYDLNSYLNPSVKISQHDMNRYAWAIYTSGRKFYNITSKAYGLTMRINNIYAVSDYFFIDFSLQNHTNIKYDIEELRIKLTDKKEAKSTNSQTIELIPDYVLNNDKSFKKDYRNVIAIKKLTYPEEKVLYIEVYENQISGRTITIPIAYEDILNADAISNELIKNFPKH